MPARRFRRYTVVLLAVLVLTVLFPFPTDEAKVLLRQAVQTSAPTIVLGSSGVDEVSRCDADQRPIPAMLAERLGEPVIDASRNGMTMETAVNVAALVAKYRDVKQVVLAAGWLDIVENDALSMHDYIAFRQLNPELSFDPPLAYYHGLQSLFATHQHIDQPFVYNGVTYPSYVPGLFEQEIKLRTCPENDGHDVNGIAATYFHRVVEYSPSRSLAQLIASLSRHLQAEQKSLVFVLLPLNFDYLGRLGPTWPDLVKQRRETFLAELRTGGVRVLDLSELLPNAEFIDRWCGCTHFSDTGRKQIAGRIAGLLSSVKLAQDQD